LVASSTREPSSAARASGSATAVSGFMLQKVLRRRDLTGPELDLRRKPAASRSPERPAGIGPRLDAGNIDAIIEAASCYSLAGVKADELERKLGYFRNNAHRMEPVA